MVFFAYMVKGEQRVLHLRNSLWITEFLGIPPWSPNSLIFALAAGSLNYYIVQNPPKCRKVRNMKQLRCSESYNKAFISKNW